MEHSARAEPSGTLCFHLVIDAVDRLPQTGDQGIYLKPPLQGKLSGHKHFIDRIGQDMPEIGCWKCKTV